MLETFPQVLHPKRTEDPRLLEEPSALHCTGDAHGGQEVLQRRLQQ